MNLKDKLRELDRVARRVDAAAPQTPETDLDHLLNGFEQDGCYLVETQYPMADSHGSVQLKRLWEIPAAALSIAGKNENLLRLDLKKALFVDTETTGLSGGSGTLAFLVGVGFFEEEQFVVRQYFLRQPHEEAAMLAALHEQVSKCSGLVTFNGKSYDIPLIQTRSILNRKTIDFDSRPHFDVLHAARRIWKDSFQDCSLTNLEYKVLGLSRTEDVPGQLIPYLYFDFVRTGNTDLLKEVFAHNRQDIVTTAALLIYLCELIQSPFKRNATTQELRKVGKLYREVGELSASADLFKKLIEKNRASNSLDDHLALGFCYKSQRLHDEAAKVWESTIDQFAFHPMPYIELAKHCEHRLRDYARAHELVQRALRSLDMLEELYNRQDLVSFKNDLTHREARLQHKIQKYDLIN